MKLNHGVKLAIFQGRLTRKHIKFVLQLLYGIFKLFVGLFKDPISLLKISIFFASRIQIVFQVFDYEIFFLKGGLEFANF